MRYNNQNFVTYENSVLTLKDKNGRNKGYVIEWDGKSRFYQGADGLVVRDKNNATPFKFFKDADMILEKTEDAQRAFNKSH